ncbi:hypothetical protein [Chelativorans sp. AA-79]|uniref:hypothetical protein n=1 Tax=Chelativorans sp. AA-79 TaxID=3028735 RepID=UPI0023F63A01|nr:hypothetical protein [Chelativorans sp. AA-79]WEX10228.1 hypothetical protein PVE73_04515 [Chelativorans sp. AA-79]
MPPPGCMDMATRPHNFLRSLLAELLPGWIKQKRKRARFGPEAAATRHRGTIAGKTRSTGEEVVQADKPQKKAGGP